MATNVVHARTRAFLRLLSLLALLVSVIALQAMEVGVEAASTSKTPAKAAPPKGPFVNNKFVLRTPMKISPYRSSAPTLIVVDKSSHYTHVLQLQGPAIVRTYSFSNSIGSDDTPTPPGNYKIIRKLKWPSWIPPKTIDPKQKAVHPYNKDRKNPLGVAALYLDREELMLHGTNDPKSIRKDVSHGCVRHSNSDISRLYGMVRPGTNVHITNSLNGHTVTRQDFGTRSKG